MSNVKLGSIIYSSVMPMIRMYLIIGSGFFVTRKGYFGVTAARAFSDMVMMIFLPALVFDKIVSYISIDDIKTIGVICFCAFIMYSINACMATLLVLFTPVPKTPKDRWVGGAILAGIMQNVSDIPISYIQAITLFTLDQQNKGTAYVIIWLAMYVVVQFNCGLFKLVDWDFEYRDKNYIEPVGLEKLDITPSVTDLERTPTLEKTLDENKLQILDTASENPISQITSISSEYENESDAGPNPILNKNIAVDSLMPLKLVTTLNSGLSKIKSSTAAISKIPSSRNADNNLNINNSEILLSQELVKEYSNYQPYNQNMSKIMKIVTESNLTTKDVDNSGEKIPFIKKYKLHYIIFFLENMLKPNSIVLIIALTIALIPWLKALFTNNGTIQLPNAPNEEPALNFILLYAEYLGYPCVPMGLLLIGSVLARLEFSQVPKGFWKTAVCHTVFRLGVLPIIGTVFISALKRIGWLSDPMAIFASTIEFCLPSATVQIYLTAAAMKPTDKTCTPLNCVGLYMIMQYTSLIVAVPITVCYCIKNVIDL